MSATSQDALTEYSGNLLKIDAPANDADLNDPTEDLAEETTSELAPSLHGAAESSAEPPARAAQAGGASGQDGLATGDNVLRERYVLETPLGSGGTAIVYRAVDLRRDAGGAEGRRVAIKMLRPEFRDRPQSIARLQREFRQTQAAAHANVVRVHDLDCDRGSWFIVMEHLAGETLGPRLRRAPSGLPLAEALRIAVEIGDALAHAHARGVTHGDVKPGNVFLTSAGEVRLLDFGVAPESHAGSAPGEAAHPAIGAAATRVYASPEVLAGEAPDPRDDVFSLACVVYEMFSGTHPYGRRSRDVAERAAAAATPPVSLDPPRWAALSRALGFTRAARPTMAELVRALRGDAAAAAPANSAPAIIAETAMATVAPHATAQRRHILLWGLVAAALAGALVFGFLIGREGPDPVPAIAPAPKLEAAAPILAPPGDETPPRARAEPPPAVPQAGTPPAEAAVQPEAVPGFVSFDSPMMIVSKRAVVAAIPLRYYSRVRRTAQVAWRVVDGTARAGRDFGGPTTGVETFVEGNTFRILYVPILPDTRSTLDRTFAVELTGASPGAELGPTQRIEVTILGTA